MVNKTEFVKVGAIPYLYLHTISYKAAKDKTTDIVILLPYFSFPGYLSVHKHRVTESLCQHG